MSSSQKTNSDVTVQTLKGEPAFSNFKLRKLLSLIQARLPEIHSINGQLCYFAYLDAESSDGLIWNLSELVIGELVEEDDLFTPDSVLVVPRLGTISPWNSKAIEILHRCGLQSIRRIERGTVWTVSSANRLDENQQEVLHSYLHDRMTESVLTSAKQIAEIFREHSPKPILEIDMMQNGRHELQRANENLGLALSPAEIDYIRNWYESQKRNPTDAELMMFSQVNSEHCRHKIFNASWTIDDVQKSQSMFSMIRSTHRGHPEGTLIAYEDNAAVIEGNDSARLFSSPVDRIYGFQFEPVHIVYKAETHNHPTAISPFPGAATGAGGEIRDEGATGIGGKPKAGICGYCVSHLFVPNSLQPWEIEQHIPDRAASPLEIMLEAPIGAASFNNEFGRPNIGGYFRTFETSGKNQDAWFGYHKPIMFAGGIGNIRPMHLQKSELQPGDHLVVIGGPAMLIGLGGGAASSLDQGSSEEDLDFASVQRSNPEMQRRCQEVIDRCCELGDRNPILSIHDVGAGGLSNALPEIVHASGRGALIDISKIPCADPAMSPLEIWCNEAQERYVVSVSDSRLNEFGEICRRERCPYSVVGQVKSGDRLQVVSSEMPLDSDIRPVDVDLDFLMAGFLKSYREDTSQDKTAASHLSHEWNFQECVDRVLRFPSVGDKTFLITIGDRTVTGMIHRDQMVGPWQVPVADASVTLSSFNTYSGEAMALGERTPIAVTDSPASVRMAVGEALTNIRSAPVEKLTDIKLCANWMAAANEKGNSADLYASVETVAMSVCQHLGLAIPVGKDSLSMSTQWNDGEGKSYNVSAPVSLIVTAFSAIEDVRRSLTPQLHRIPESTLLLVDLGNGQNRIGMSVLSQTYNHISSEVPDLDNLEEFRNCFEALGELGRQELVLAYHDRSDGGLFTTLAEMAFAGRCGLDLRFAEMVRPIEFFFNEELGAVIQVEKGRVKEVMEQFKRFDIDHLVINIGSVDLSDRMRITIGNELIFDNSRVDLHRKWSELTWRMQSIRDNPECAKQEYDRILDTDDPGLRHIESPIENRPSVLSGPEITGLHRPRVAILREQGVNGHVEMAGAFHMAGFDACDVVMSDLNESGANLDCYEGIILCGGFSFGDVLGAGKGWASTILYQNQLRDMFESFFRNELKFALGVCNGCQVMSSLREIIPGSQQWPDFTRNESDQFEARLTMVEITPSQSIFTQGFQGSYLPIAVAHGEGRVSFLADGHPDLLLRNKQIACVTRTIGCR